MYLFTNLLGSFVLNERMQIIDKILFKDIKEFLERENKDKILQQKHKAIAVPKEKLAKVLLLFKDTKYYPELQTRNTFLTKQAVKESVTEDNLITQAIANISELDRICNLLTKRLREWYSLYFPELSKTLGDHEKFVELVSSKKREELLKELNVQYTMGADIDKEDLEEILLLAQQTKELYTLRAQHEKYLQKIMKKHCPNFLELAGTTIGAKLLELGKGLKHVAMLPASTIQLLGAEKALFRHIRSGTKSPKYGILYQHPLVQRAKRSDQGKAARMLADKLSLCARLDYFKGEFKAEEFRKELEGKLDLR